MNAIPAVTLLSGGTVVTMDPARRVIEDGAVAFSAVSGHLLAVGTAARLHSEFPAADMVNTSGQVVLPGFVNTHTHLFQTLLKGLGDDRVLSDWFVSMTGPSAVELTEEDCYAAALHGCVEAMTTGTTTIVDFMYVHPRPGLGDAVAGAMHDAGIRGVMARGYVTARTEHRAYHAAGRGPGRRAGRRTTSDQQLEAASASRVRISLARCMSCRSTGRRCARPAPSPTPRAR